VVATVRRATSLLLVLATSLACSQGDEPAAEAQPGTPAAGTPPAAGAAGTVEPRREFAGAWFVLAPELPAQGLYLTLETSGDDDHWDGSWISFDWRGTEEGSHLARVSRPVEASARRDGGEIVIVGAVPEVDARGRPTGRSGRWELRVARSSLPGQPLQYTGRMVHDDQPIDVPVELLSNFRPWAP
jgi:hypothetical protein